MSTSQELIATAFQHLQSGEFSQAIDACQAALVIEQTVAAYNVQTIALARSGHLPEAIETAKAATRLDPANADSWHNLAVLLHMAGQLEDALAAVWCGLKVYPTHFALWFERAKLFAKVGRIDDAIKIAVELQESQPQDPRGFHVGATAYLKAGRVEESIACSEREKQLRQIAKVESQTSLTVIQSPLGSVALPE